jgi:transcription antitermination factor NusG
MQPVISDLQSTYLDAPPSEMLWFALQTRPRYEKKATVELQEKGFDSFLPLHCVRHQWSDREGKVSLPLFPGYTFVRIAPAQSVRVAVLRTNGVTGFVGMRGVGTSIPETEIEAVQRLLKENILFKVHPYLKVGEPVRIRGGCLDGIKGILARINGDQSLVISVELIQRSVAMRLTGYDVEPA